MGSINRRIFLRGLGGACVAAPFLGSLGGRALRAQAPEAPKRLIVMFTHYGCITTRFFPRKSHGELSADDLAPTTLRPLAPYVDKLLLPRGIRVMNEWTSDMSRGQGNDPMTQVAGSYFTCQPVTPNSNDPFDFDPAKKNNAKPIGPSLDHVIAQQLSPGGVPLFMRVGNFNDPPMSAISYSAAETGYPGLGKATDVLAQLTGLFPGGAPNPDTYAAIKGKSINDLVKDDLETLERFDMSGADRMKLEAWKALLHDTTTAVGSAQCNPETAELIGASQAVVDAVGSSGSGTFFDIGAMVTETLDGADVYTNLAVLASICQANPVIVLKYPANYRFASLGMTIESASLNNRTGNASMQGTCVTGVLDMLHAIDDYYARKFAHLVDLLARIDEGDGKVLDNSAAVWFQQYSDGCAKNCNNMPIVQAGSLGGFFKTGRAVNVEDGSADLTPGNSEYYCGEDGNDQVNAVYQLTGTDASVANAPINKYYVSLMNALGVKAGEDGFAAVGGTREVAKFGMYDKTEDFIGGGTKEAVIHDPGGFEALEA
ncbi:MAG TPA: DUF1552 domain-containing protein [Polyangiaceae bacterium]